MNEIARSVITIDPDFAAIWGDLDNAAYEGLKAEIMADGIRDPLVIWNPDNNHILVDGHNRLKVAKELNMMAVPVSYKVFKDKADAADWIVNHQSARRNITDWQKYKAIEVYRRILREQARAAQLANLKKGDASPVLENSPKRDKPIDTRKEVAKAAGISEWKVRQGDYIQKNATEEQKAALDSGTKTMKEVFNETYNANKPKKADRLKEARETLESTKQDGKTVDLQMAKIHKEAENRLNNELAHETYDSIYLIMREGAKLTDESVDNFFRVYSQKEWLDVLHTAKSVWDIGQKLVRIGERIQEVKG